MNRILAPNGPPQVAVASPLNDVQLIALMAATIYEHAGDVPGYAASDAVAYAVEILAQAVMSQPAFIRRIQELQAAQEAGKFTEAVNQ